MRKGIVATVAALVLTMLVTAVLSAGCGGSKGLIPLELYVPVSCPEGESVDCAISIPYPSALPVVVNIAASGASNLLSAAVIIPAGEVYVEFTLEVMDDQIAAPNVSLTLTASAPGYVPDSAPFTIVDAGS